MTAYRKNLCAWAFVIGVGLTLGFSLLYISQWFIIPFGILVFGSHRIFERIECPNCGFPVYRRDEAVQLRLPSPADLFRRNCGRCGFDLNDDKS